MIMIYGEQETDSTCRNHEHTERKYCVNSSNVEVINNLNLQSDPTDGRTLMAICVGTWHKPPPPTKTVVRSLKEFFSV
jgi:hypothetical protein